MDTTKTNVPSLKAKTPDKSVVPSANLMALGSSDNSTMASGVLRVGWLQDHNQTADIELVVK